MNARRSLCQCYSQKNRAGRAWNMHLCQSLKSLWLANPLVLWEPEQFPASTGLCWEERQSHKVRECHIQIHIYSRLRLTWVFLPLLWVISCSVNQQGSIFSQYPISFSLSDWLIFMINTSDRHITKERLHEHKLRLSKIWANKQEVL